MCTKKNRLCYINVLNLGAFKVKFWGSYTVCCRHYTFKSNIFITGSKYRINLPSNATNIIINIDCCKFTDNWINICTKTYPKCASLSLLTYGVFFHPFCKEILPNHLKVLNETLPKGFFIPSKTYNKYTYNKYTYNSQNNPYNNSSKPTNKLNMLNTKSLSNPSPKSGYIYILNYGGFLVRFNGTYRLNKKTLGFYSGIFPVGESRKIIIPQNATDIYFKVQISPFPFVWSGIYKNTFEVSDERCFLTYGISFWPNCISIPCTSPNVFKKALGKGTFIPSCSI